MLEIPEYRFEEFKDIVLSRLKEENLSEDISGGITEKVWHEVGSKDIRDAIKIGRLSRSIEDVAYMVKITKKISCKNKGIN